MKLEYEFDFGGYATKNDLRCSDGRVIGKDAFKHHDKEKVPLLWQHGHDAPENVLGHAILENRADGVYAYCKFNDTTSAKHVKELVKHGDVKALSIFANHLKQEGMKVIHGMIKEVSVVLAGANPGATIDNISFEHSDGSVFTSESEALIQADLGIEMPEDVVKHAEGDETVQEVFDTLNDKQKNLVYAMLADALEKGKEDVEHSNEGGNEMKTNVFENQNGNQNDKTVLAHSELRQKFPSFVQEAIANKTSLKQTVLQHAQEYGIENIDFLFPDAKSVTPTPEMISRRMEWVPKVVKAASHSPFSRIKSLAADITEEEARARGYIKGNLKKEEVIKLLKRITTPKTVYKKQKLDRDDIIDIKDFNVVAWLKAEMRVMLDEELSRAVLIGDGRDVASDDKINEENIRPIYKDDDLYSHKVTLPAAIAAKDLVDEILKARINYKGSGSPVFFTTNAHLMSMLLLKDTLGRRLYRTKAELAAELNVSEIVEVEVMENVTRTVTIEAVDHVRPLIGIIVNMTDYRMGADAGGEISFFDDFDIDYNQYKYLLETRVSGALIRPKSALVIEKAADTEAV
jgi:HK97 family phage prohead protease